MRLLIRMKLGGCVENGKGRQILDQLLVETFELRKEYWGSELEQ